MEKTKLGVSVAVMGAAVYFMGLYSFIPAALLVAYILWAEDNEWLKKTAVKMVVVLLSFALFGYFLDMIDYLFSVINVMVSWVGGKRIAVPLNLTNLLNYILSALRLLLMVVLGLKALNKDTIALGPVDTLVDKAIGVVEAAKSGEKTE